VLHGSASITNGQLVLNAGSQDYLQFPAGLITNLEALTVEAWASFGANGWWCRLWDFGDSSGGAGQNCIFFSPHSSDGTACLRLWPTSYGNEERIDHAGVLDYQTNVHIVAVLNPPAGSMALFIDGLLACQANSATAPLSTVHDVTNFLGRSLSSWDPSLNGSIDEFRIWAGALSPLDVAVHKSLGPGIAATNAGFLQTIAVVAPTNILREATANARVLAQFQNVTNVDVTLLEETAYQSSDPTVLMVDSSGLLTAITPGLATLTVSYGGKQASLLIHVQTPVCSPPPSGLVGWWPGNGTFADLMGEHPGAPSNGVSFADGLVGQSFNLNGTDCVELGAWFNLQTFTISMWVKAGGSQVTSYADILDNNHTGSRSWVIQYNNSDDALKSYFYWSAANIGFLNFGLTKGVWQHLVVTLDTNRTASAYLDGNPVATVAGSADIFYDGTQFLRLGCWGGGGRNFNGQVDELAIFNRALSPAEIKAIYNAFTAGMCPLALDISRQPSAVQLSWFTSFTGFSLESCSQLPLPGNWVRLVNAPVVVSNRNVVTVPLTNAASFFRLKKP
jgi:hypothetical protein